MLADIKPSDTYAAAAMLWETLEEAFPDWKWSPGFSSDKHSVCVTGGGKVGTIIYHIEAGCPLLDILANPRLAIQGQVDSVISMIEDIKNPAK